MPCSVGLMYSLGTTPPLMSLINSKPLPGLVGLDADLHVAVVARAAGLPDVLAFGLGGLANGLAIGHLGLAHVGLDLVLAHHAVDDDLQVQLAHAADDGLARIRIRMHLEGRIFLRQLGQSHAHLFLIGLGLRLDGHVRSPARESRSIQARSATFRCRSCRR